MTTPQASQPLHVALGPASDEEIITNPNEKPTNSRFTPARYLRQIEKHSDTSARTSLYHGAYFLCLAQFLKRGSENPLSISEADKFATFYKLQNDQRSPFPATLSLPGSNGDHLLASETGIILLEGYPSAQRLLDLGAAYNIDPEFYQRHLRYLNPRLNKNASFHVLVLPSFQTSILQTSVTTISHHVTPGYRSVGEKRLHSAGKMYEYLMNLRNGRGMGRNWEPRDSVVRSFAVHDEKEFSIQQLNTICMIRVAGGDECWKVIIWLDAGKPLISSPVGPGSSPVDDIYLDSVTLYKPGVALTDH